MKDKTEKIASFKDYFREVRAREKSATLKEYSERLLFEDKVRRALENLKKQEFSIQAGLIDVTPIEEKKDFERPDFIVSKEDILFQLYYQLNVDRGVINRDFLRRLSDVIQSNPKVTAFIIVWNFDDLPSCVLDPFVLRKYIEETEDKISLKSEEIYDLNKTILDFYNKQFVDWPIPKDILTGEEERLTINVVDVFRQSIVEELKKLEKREFTIPEKKASQNLMRKLNINMIMNNLIDLLSKTKLTMDDFEAFEALLDRELKRIDK